MSGDMNGDEIEQQIEGIAALRDPVRRNLYLYVVRQDHGVLRDEAAAELNISRGLAAFHLDKLVKEGLLEVTYRRLTGRSGPGAGRPSKLYHRARRQFDITLPPRSYELAARLFAQALEVEHSGSDEAPLPAVAHDFGENLGRQALALSDPSQRHDATLEAMETVLNSYGFEPHRDPNGDLRLRNCPFHALALQHRELVCGMNLSIMQGLVEGISAAGVEAELDPQPGMCCVRFRVIEA